MNDLSRVSYLGPEATFTHEAAILRFGDGAVLTPEPSIDAVFDEVEGRRSRWGVVPIENAIEGTVNITLDRLLESPLLVEGEIRLPIDIHLLTNARSIPRGGAHSQPPPRGGSVPALASGKCLGRQDGRGVEHLAGGEDGRRGTRGSRPWAAGWRPDHYGLKILEEKLDSESINVTRFFVIGTEKPERAAHSKTSLLFGLPNESGALHKALEPIAERKLNMTKIESRPSRKEAWEYVFYMEIDSRSEDEAITQGISELKNRVDFIRVLGSYPVLQKERTRI